jgi:Cu+-exporting ATPase
MDQKNVTCSHCHLEFPEDVMIKEDDLYFCCKGCQGVYHLIHDKDLDSFYSKVANQKLAPPPDTLLDAKTFDSEAFQEQYVKKNGDYWEISLVIEGIHCSACVWLNEQVLYETQGVIKANINFSTNRAKIVFDKNIIPLSKIIDTIRAIGYDAVPFEITEQKEQLDKERRDYYIRLSVAIFGVMNIMWIAIALYAGYFSGIEQDVKTILNIAEWILATPVLFYSGWIFFRGSYFAIKNRIVNMDLLVASGAFLTYLYSIYITVTESGEAYFDSVAMIITFILVGKFLELLSKRSIAESLDLIGKYQPLEVELENGEKIAISDLKIGDKVKIKAGERIGVDGKISEGEGTVDEAMITGESIPVLKKVGDKVLSGTLLTDGFIKVEVEKSFKDSYITKLVSMLEDAINHKPEIENLANQVSGKFSGTILILAVLTFLGWGFSTNDWQHAFIVSVSVLIIACPCALGLATPIATLVGLNLGMKKGILFKEARFLETMAKADILAIDKTGTLTYGKIRVLDVIKFNNFNENYLVALLKTSNHPISKGVLEYLKNNQNLTKTNINIQNLEIIAGRGLKAKIDNLEIVAGNLQLMKDLNINIPQDLEIDTSHLFYAENQEIKVLFKLKDKLREDSRSGIEQIKNLGIQTVILSGDNNKIVEKIADEVQADNWFGELKPHEKLQWIKEQQQNGKIVVMVGDGINDILALASADIGIAIGSGSDIAMEVGDIVLQKDSIEVLAQSFKISKSTLSLIKSNLGLSLIYNSITIPLAILGYVIPLVASISMSLSSLLVVTNSLRRLFFFKS